ncbi:hypothetical protein [Guggenheimella bovis]
MITTEDKLRVFKKVTEELIQVEFNKKKEELENDLTNRFDRVKESSREEFRRRRERLQVRVQNEYDEKIASIEEQQHLSVLQLKNTFLNELYSELRKELESFLRSPSFFEAIQKKYDLKSMTEARGSIYQKDAFEALGIPYEVIEEDGVVLFNEKEKTRYDFRLDRILEKKRPRLAMELERMLEEATCKE